MLCKTGQITFLCKSWASGKNRPPPSAWRKMVKNALFTVNGAFFTQKPPGLDDKKLFFSVWSGQETKFSTVWTIKRLFWPSLDDKKFFQPGLDKRKYYFNAVWTKKYHFSLVWTKKYLFSPVWTITRFFQPGLDDMEQECKNSTTPPPTIR